MNSTNYLPQTYTPDEVAQILKLSTNTVYNLISKGEIIAKRIGKTLRIPKSSISFVFTGLDDDLYRAQLEDEKNLKKIETTLKDVRKDIWAKSQSF